MRLPLATTASMASLMSVPPTGALSTTTTTTTSRSRRVVETVVRDPRELRKARTGADEVAVGSYNVLAPLYVRPVDLRLGTVQAFAAFEWCSDEAVEWGSREARLRERVAALCEGCDAVCLQEVEFDGDGSVPRWLVESIEAGGLRVACVPTAADLSRIAERNERVLGARRAVGNVIASRRVEWSSALSSTSLCVGLGEDWVVVNVHLDAGSEAKRLETVGRALDAVEWLQGPRAKVVVAGDWNAEFFEGSPLRALVDAAEPSEDQYRRELERARFDGSLEAWRALWHAAPRRPALARVDTGPTRAGYDHDDTKTMASWGLDHLLCSSRLAVLAKLSTLEADARSLRDGLPNHVEPSDHLPVAALFRAPPPVPDRSADAVLDDLRRRDAADRAQTDALLDQVPLPHAASKQSPERVAAVRRRRKLNTDYKARAAERRRAVLDHIRADPLLSVSFESRLLAAFRDHGAPGTQLAKQAAAARGGVPPRGVRALVDAWLAGDFALGEPTGT